jgi:NADH:ubiquinone oxidoreductase subunit F (NADH-binding)
VLEPNPPKATPARDRVRPRSALKGRQPDPAVVTELQGWLGEPPPRERLIEALHVIQDRLGALPAPHLVALASWMKLAPAEVYEVASFYHHFDVIHEDAAGLLPKVPGLIVRVCTSLPCQMAGSAELLARLPALLGAGVRVLPTPCVGRCDQAPVAVVHQHPVPRADTAQVQAAVAARRTQADLPPALDLPAYRAAGGYALLCDALAGRRTPDELIAALDDAGLRGLGGAGFPAARKWRVVRAQPAPRLMAVNIDEGEPGTFKDRWLLERDPHRFLEGMLLAAWVVDAARIVIYLRDEYHGCRQLLQRELQALRAQPWMAGRPPIELRRGAGAYICGEESAMLESIEGKRGMPRLRPPFVAEAGLWGRPTLVHNLETLYWVREIVERGAQAFAAHGRHGRTGLRRFSVSGRVREPGVKLAPAGITLRELVAEHCGGMAAGHELYAYLPGGASGGLLPAHLADVPLDFDTLQPHGCFIGSAAVIVLSQADRAADAARNVMDFFVHESCGQCTPCRAGTAKAAALMAVPHWDAGLLRELGAVMRDASICGLGQAAPNVVDSVLQHFAHEVRP